MSRLGGGGGGMGREELARHRRNALAMEKLRIADEEDEWGVSPPSSRSAGAAALPATTFASGGGVVSKIVENTSEETKKRVMDAMNDDEKAEGDWGVDGSEESAAGGTDDPNWTEMIFESTQTMLDNIEAIKKEDRRHKEKNPRYVILTSSEDEEGDSNKPKKEGDEVVCKQGGRKCRGVRENGKCICDPRFMAYRKWMIEVTGPGGFAKRKPPSSLFVTRRSRRGRRNNDDDDSDDDDDDRNFRDES